MIDPLRYIGEISAYKLVQTSLKCTRCTNNARATIFCDVCKPGFMCDACHHQHHFSATEAVAAIPKGSHIVRRIVYGSKSGHFKRILRFGNGLVRPKFMDTVMVKYILRVKPNAKAMDKLGIDSNSSHALDKAAASKHRRRGSSAKGLLRNANKGLLEAAYLKRHSRGCMQAVESTYWTNGRPLMFQIGSSGPCFHLQVLDCIDLAAADLASASDPYVTVHWRDKVPGSTRVKWMTLNPKWSRETFVLPMEPSFYQDLVTFLYSEDHEEKRRITDRYRIKALSSTPILRLDVFDYDAMNKNDFLGQKIFYELDLLKLCKAQSPFCPNPHQLSFKLSPKQANGKVGLRVYWDEWNKIILLKVTGCHGLDVSDVLTATADPFCKVFWNGKLVGKTSVVNGTLNPVWDDAFFDIRVEAACKQNGEKKADILEDCTLRVEVYDWDKYTSHDPLGQLEVAGEALYSFLNDHRLDLDSYEALMTSKWSEKYDLLWEVWNIYRHLQGASAAGGGEGPKGEVGDFVRRIASPKAGAMSSTAKGIKLGIKVLHPKVIREGYISRWYGDGQCLVFFEEDNPSNWLDGDMALIGPTSAVKLRVDGPLDWLSWNETYELLTKMALTYLDSGLRKGARIKTQRPAYWREARVIGIPADANGEGLLLKYSDQEDPIVINQDTPLRVKVDCKDMRFQPWSFAYRLLQCLYAWANMMAFRKLNNTGGPTQEDLVMARSLDVYDDFGNISGSGIITGHNPHMGLCLSLDSGESRWVNSDTPLKVRLYYTDMAGVPWSEVYGMLLRLWNHHAAQRQSPNRQSYHEDTMGIRMMDVGIKVYYQEPWKSGYIASYEKHEGLRIVYDEPEQAALGAQATQVPSSLENNNKLNIPLDQLPRYMITKATPTIVQIEGWWDFLSWSDTEELLRKMSDHRMTLDVDLDPETAAELTKEEELEMKRLKARVQILYENRWRRGSIVNFDRTTGMELVFRDGGGTALTVTRESPLMIRVDDLVGLEEEISKNNISWVPLPASGSSSVCLSLMTIDDCILGATTMFGLNMFANNGAGFVKGSIGFRLLAHHRGAVLEGIDKCVTTMTLGEKARLLIRYAEGLGDVWGGPFLPEESDLEVDLELLEVNNQRDPWSVRVMSLVEMFGFCGIWAYQFFTGIPLPTAQLASSAVRKGKGEGVEVDENGWPVIDEEGGDEEKEADETGQGEVEEELDGETQIPEEELEKKRLEEERLREEDELSRENRSTELEASVLFSAPKFNIR